MFNPNEDDAKLVIAFLNTLDVEAGSDALADHDSFADWLDKHSLPTCSDIKHARFLRDSLREAVTHGCAPVDAECESTLKVEIRDSTPVLVSTEPAGQVLVSAVKLAMAGTWNRVKICPADDCLWAFWDDSRNRSGKWCSMAVCGNRQKTKAFRAKHAEA